MKNLGLALLLMLLTGCAVNPVTGKSELRLVPESTELNLGAEQYAPSRQSQGGITPHGPRWRPMCARSATVWRR